MISLWMKGIKGQTMNAYKFSFFTVYSFIHMCVQSLGHLSPLPLPSLPPTLLTSRQNLFCPLLQFCWREDINDNKKDMAFLLAWDKDSYIEIPCIAFMHMCITTQMVHLYQTSSLFPGPLPIVTSVILRLLY
jgi:hypothetical protein